MEEMNFILEAAKEGMTQAIAHLEKEMLNIRAGKANPIMLSTVKIDYYGTPTPLAQVANINTPDARTLTVQPWEKNLVPDIEKAILIANLGFNPMNNGEAVIINIPPLTEERRRDLFAHLNNHHPSVQRVWVVADLDDAELDEALSGMGTPKVVQLYDD